MTGKTINHVDPHNQKSIYKTTTNYTRDCHQFPKHYSIFCWIYHSSIFDSLWSRIEEGIGNYKRDDRWEI